MDNRSLGAGEQFKGSCLQVEEHVYRTDSLTLFKSFYTIWAFEHLRMALEHNPWMVEESSAYRHMESINLPEGKECTN